MSVVPPAENVRRSNATDTVVLAPKVYTLRGAFFNKLKRSRNSGCSILHKPALESREDGFYGPTRGVPGVHILWRCMKMR